MHQRFWDSISRAGVAAVALGVFISGSSQESSVSAQTAVPASQPKQTTEPVFRVSKLTEEKATEEKTGAADSSDQKNSDRIADTRSLPRSVPAVLPTANTNSNTATAAATKRAPHPLDRAVDVAEVSLREMRADVRDYTAILAKRENINGVIGKPSYMNVKIRCPRQNADGSSSPFSVYMKFLRPKEAAGREVLWTQGENDGNLIAHEGSGILRLKRFVLDPEGTLAMRGQRYPIYEAGLENLIVKLLEKANRDRAAGPCEVTYREGAKINKRSCSLIELVHEEKRAPYEFYKAQVFIDDELNLPVRYAAYDWPATPGGEPVLLEEYTYYNVKVNVGLTDNDFSPENKGYRFPKR